MHAIVQEDPPFDSVAVALRFALNFRHGNVKEPLLSRLLKQTHRGRGLGGLDGAAQAGLILAELGKLPPERRLVLEARYSDPSEPCRCGSPCCVGYRESREWTEAVYELAEYVLHNTGGIRISHVKLRRASVKRYFGVKSSFREISAQCGVKPDTASSHNNKIVQCLSQVEKIARYEIEDRLKTAGVID
jgi:hypothetical protein